MASAFVAFEQERSSSSSQLAARLKVFYDCNTDGCHADFIREEVDFVEYVRDRSDADVHVLVTTATTGARGREYTLAFIGQGALAMTKRTLTIITEPSDPDDRVRRRLATSVTLGLLGFSSDRVPAELSIDAALATSSGSSASSSADRWNRWIFSLNGYGTVEAEESQREREWGVSIGADRVTPSWKLSFGSNIERSKEEFDLDDDRQLTVERHDQSFNGLAVGALSPHWSAGVRGQVRSATFDNTALDVELAPAIEWNFFPYEMYTRRQLRVQYAVGGIFRRYYETTLFGKLEETRGGQEITGTYEQREPWGTLEGSVEFSNYFPGFSQNRVSVDGEVDVRVARGLSVSFEASASRIRDRLSLPRRDATPEEVLLRLRQLSSGFETRIEFGIEYQFGSRFASIVNPRFGQ